MDKSITINEALMFAQSADRNVTYIVMLKKDNSICHLGKTTSLFTYIGLAQRTKNADEACIGVVEEEYADDLVIALRVHFDYDLDKIHISSANRKYTTLKQAVFAYKHEGVKRKDILAAIKEAQIKTVDLLNGQTLIDKVMLLNSVNTYQSNRKS